jgi:hypothetical protein
MISRWKKVIFTVDDQTVSKIDLKTKRATRICAKSPFRGKLRVGQKERLHEGCILSAGPDDRRSVSHSGDGVIDRRFRLDAD